MQKKGGNISFIKYDDIFSTEQSRAEDRLEKVREIPLAELHPFKNHPFKVLDDESMQRTVESIARFGVLSPAIARPSPDGGYELVAGHRRHHACELVGMETMPVIVRELDDDAATILMVDSNLQRETLLPSERAFAYKMKLEAIKHQGMRSDLTSTQVAQKLSVHTRKWTTDTALHPSDRTDPGTAGYGGSETDCLQSCGGAVLFEARRTETASGSHGLCTSYALSFSGAEIKEIQPGREMYLRGYVYGHG